MNEHILPLLESVPVLSVRDLNVDARTPDGLKRILDHVSFDLGPGETLCLAGESGSGKSVTSLSIMGLLPKASLKVASGAIELEGRSILGISHRALRRIRGGEIAMIFQEPMTSLNPVMTIGEQLIETIREHQADRGSGAEATAKAMLDAVQISNATARMKQYPHELSGGMRQRVMIAMALASKPKLLIADEPTTGLDVTTQAAIMDLIAELGAEQGMSTLLITHDLGMAAEYCDQIVVMHAGHIVEMAPTAELFAHPRHPYTAKLIAATPKPSVSLKDLAAIPGNLPDLRAAEIPPCRYSARCERRQARCDQALPQVMGELKDSMVACWNPL